MPYRIEVSNGLLKAWLFGNLTPEELENCMAEISELESSMNPVLDRLTDVSDVESIFLNFKAIERVALLRRSMEFKNRFKSAFIAPKDVQYGLCRMFQTLNINPMITIAVFRNKDAAIEWLKSE